MTNHPAKPETPLPHHDSTPDFIESANACLRRLMRWHVPPNWSSAEWHEELRAVAMFAAVEAADVFDAERGVSKAAFIRSRVLARALTFYRHEWAYAKRHCGDGALAGQDDELLSQVAFPPTSAIQGSLQQLAREALASLSNTRRKLLEELYLHEKTEADVGRALGISQRAVNKRKHVALLELRRRLAPTSAALCTRASILPSHAVSPRTAPAAPVKEETNSKFRF